MSSIGLNNGLVAIGWQAIIWINDGQIYCRIYALFGLNELNVTHVLRLRINQIYWI